AGYSGCHHKKPPLVGGGGWLGRLIRTNAPSSEGCRSSAWHRRPGSSPKGIAVAGQRRIRTGFAVAHRPGCMCPAAREYRTDMTSAAILTIGNEVVSGDDANTNAPRPAARHPALVHN